MQNVHAYPHVYLYNTTTCIILRAWKKHLKSASKENQLSIYQTLCLLESEVDVNKFHTLMSQFIAHWEPREQQFIGYFKEHYQDRAGKCVCVCVCVLYVLPVIHVLYFQYLEKWARCYRHFEHADTDTNMFLERYD